MGDLFNELINEYRDIIIDVFQLGINCYGDNCIIRVTDWDYIRELKCRVYGLMVDPEQVNELLRHPSMIKLLLKSGVNRFIVYPCITQDKISLLNRLGFTIMNYLVNDDCTLTKEVVIHLDTYKIINLVNKGIIVYVHLYYPYIKGKKDTTYDINSMFDAALEYLRRSGVKIRLILDVNGH
ncbi:hypothetical protein VMUT_0375 [Vulcanisaeta moutnovskia 768-28]|uniref:Uncharacterized protein n=1 Tax=Vulcanisaeta moutnovskia (strain 768-28) TaxID=985053 RepID=F0QU48_VULM7|nr:hypothetical protein [Vulcanisaeta moutnovskia]ADY00588.1 hypothetical protein VMUT_0375 [Vulcanisaeta moutnovskia 768-28]